MTAGKKMELEIEGRTFQVQVDSMTSGRATVRVDGRPVEVIIRQPDRPVVDRPAPQTKAPSPGSPRPAPQARPAAGNELYAVMPGVVTRLLVTEGQQVAPGDVLLVLEAMKMENEIRSDRDGKIERVHVSDGQKVQTGDVMITFA